VVFEKTANDVVFRGYRPGRGSGECVSISKNEKQDRLICITGFLGQGHLESSVIEWIFTRDFSKNIQLAQDSFVSATDSAGAYGANKVNCKTPRDEFLSFSKLGRGPIKNTVSVEIAYASEAAIKKACRSGTPPPKEAISSPEPGEAFIPASAESHETFIIDL